jgi:hypothetical protein
MYTTENGGYQYQASRITIDTTNIHIAGLKDASPSLCTHFRTYVHRRHNPNPPIHQRVDPTMTYPTEPHMHNLYNITLSEYIRPPKRLYTLYNTMMWNVERAHRWTHFKTSKRLQVRSSSRSRALWSSPQGIERC